MLQNWTLQRTSAQPSSPAVSGRQGVGLALFFAVLATCAAPLAAAQSPTNVAGIWFDSAGEGAIELAPCGTRMCGHIVWLKQPLNAQGKPLHDRNNPDSSKHIRPICGLQILRDLQPMTDGSWGRGIVYDPKKGAENEASIKLLGPQTLQLTGYGLFGLSKSFQWARAPEDLPRCGGSSPATNANGAGIIPGAKAAVPVAKDAVAKPVTAPATAGAASAPAAAKPALAAPAKSSPETQKSLAKPSSAAPAAKATPAPPPNKAKVATPAKPAERAATVPGTGKVAPVNAAAQTKTVKPAAQVSKTPPAKVTAKAVPANSTQTSTTKTQVPPAKKPTASSLEPAPAATAKPNTAQQ